VKQKKGQPQRSCPFLHAVNVPIVLFYLPPA
jgi:hypothetical protein